MYVIFTIKTARKAIAAVDLLCSSWSLQTFQIFAHKLS